MKKKLIILTVIFVLLISICGCKRISKYLPGENEGDDQFVWVCEKPFAFFYIPDDKESYYGFLKGYIEKGGEFVCFYSAFLNTEVQTYFKEETSFRENTDFGSIFENESFNGDGTYFEDEFRLDIEDDPANFFDGELPELRFDKMTKEEFLEKYGDIEGVSERLE